jgi:predicted esterase YcpF (UPF0227 family)
MILYLHGLDSSGASAKAQALRAGLAPLPVLTPTYPAHRPAQAVAELSARLETLCAAGPVALAGSSMGGFYGQYLARRFPVRHLYLINPALRPWELLPRFLGPRQSATGECYELRPEHAGATRPYGVERVDDGVPTTLFLDRGDETIDYRIALNLYAHQGRLLVFDGGSHGFDHLPEAIALLRLDYGLLSLPGGRQCSAPPDRCPPRSPGC